MLYVLPFLVFFFAICFRFFVGSLYTYVCSVLRLIALRCCFTSRTLVSSISCARRQQFGCLLSLLNDKIILLAMELETKEKKLDLKWS